MKIKPKPFQARQGDVLIEAVEAIPADAIKSKGRVILAHGEVTGHAHEIDRKDAAAFTLPSPFTLPGDLPDAGSMTCLALTVTRPTEAKHQEHGPIPLETRRYRSTRQREYSPEAIRNVAD